VAAAGAKLTRNEIEFNNIYNLMKNNVKAIPSKAANETGALKLNKNIILKHRWRTLILISLSL